MEILIQRKRFTPESTISDVSFDGVFAGHTLEDFDRGLTQTMPLSEIMQRKVKGKTAIPTGRYEVVISYSNRFQKMLPLLVGVPGFSGIRIHPGNVSTESDGCLLPGLAYGPNNVQNSRQAFTSWMLRIQNALRHEKVYVTITR